MQKGVLRLSVFFVFVLISRPSAAQYVSNGYADKLSYFPGETAGIYISGAGVHFGIKVYLYDVLGFKVDSAVTNVGPQYPVSTLSYETGFGYYRNFNYVVPNLPSGLYSFDNKIFFIIKSHGPKSITIVYPTNTVLAYDSSGGKSLYDAVSTNHQKSKIVSFLRPWDHLNIATNVAGSNGILRWLLHQPNIDYRLISDMDMDDYRSIDSSQIVMIIGHSEYWTRKARRNFDRFVDDGGNAMVLSGNTMWWQVRYDTTNTQLICYREYMLDPITEDSLKTVTWPDPILTYPVLQSIGCDWPNGAYGTASPRGFDGYKITNPNSPIFAGTGLRFGDTLSCVSGELDAAPVLGFETNGVPIIDSDALGFCKVELLGWNYGKLPSDITIATSYGTFIAFKKTPTSGKVVNTAFNEFTSVLSTDTTGLSIARTGGFGGKDSLKIQQITANIIDILLTGKNMFVPKNSVTGPDTGAAGGNQRFICTDFGPAIQWQVSTTSPKSAFVDILDANDDTLNYSFLVPGTYWIRVVYVDSLTACSGDLSNVIETHVGNPCDYSLTISPLEVISMVTNEVQGSNNGFIHLLVNGGVAPYRFQWSTGETTASLANIGAGIYTATVTDAFGCFRVVTDTVRLLTGIAGEEPLMVDVYPNPSSNDVQLRIILGNTEDLFIEVRDVNGRLVMKKTQAHVQTATVRLNFEREEAGVYTAVIKMGGNLVTKKILIAK